MKRKIYSFIVMLSCAAVGADNSEAYKSYELFEKIKEEVKTKYNCKLSPEEFRDVVELELNYSNVNMETIAKATKPLRRIIDGLTVAVNEEKDSDEIYSELHMESFDISVEQWNHYYSNYLSAEKIQALKDIIPTSMEDIIETELKRGSKSVEDWLLREYILMVSNMGNEVLDKFSAGDIIVEWWQQVIDQDYEDLSLEDRMMLSDMVNKYFAYKTWDKGLMAVWKEYFNERLQRQISNDLPDTEELETDIELHQ